MKYDKTYLRNISLLERKRNYLSVKKFNFNLIFKLIRKHFPEKKIIIAGYYPSNYEVNILKFLQNATTKKFKIVLPVIRPSGKMSFKSWVFEEPLYVSKFGTLEPKNSNKEVAPDLIMVPLVAFDSWLNRIGYGRGYYDRVLKQLSAKKKILTIGLAFSFQECSFVPTNQHDYKLDCILTEKKLHYNKSNENFIFR